MSGNSTLLMHVSPFFLVFYKGKSIISEVFSAYHPYFIPMDFSTFLDGLSFCNNDSLGLRNNLNAFVVIDKTDEIHFHLDFVRKHMKRLRCIFASVNPRGGDF